MKFTLRASNNQPGEKEKAMAAALRQGLHGNTTNYFKKLLDLSALAFLIRCKWNG